MLDMVCEEFDKVIVLLNIPATMEAGFLTDPDYYAYNANIDAAMYIGFPGKQGTLAIGDLLAGKATPSGHTVDVWAKNFKNDPTFVNFGDNNITDGDKYTAPTLSNTLPFGLMLAVDGSADRGQNRKIERLHYFFKKRSKKKTW